MRNCAISLLIPTYNRIDALNQLLDSLRHQTVSPECFEVIIVDDGSTTPVSVEANAYPFAIRLFRQANAGPAAARNTGLKHVRAPLTLILNDDAIAANDLIETHLKVHAQRTDKVAVLGQFPFVASLLNSPFMKVLDASDLLFPHRYLTPWELHGGGFFWTCNLSIATAALRAVDGFDEATFHDAICEDIELGFRLQQRGYQVLYVPEAVCEHDHYISPEAYARRGRKQGINMVKLARIHGWHHLQLDEKQITVHDFLEERRKDYAQMKPKAESVLAMLMRLESRKDSCTIEQLQKIHRAAWWVDRTEYYGGLIDELARTLESHWPPLAIRIA